MAWVNVAYVLQLIIHNGLPLYVKLDLMKAGVWVERKLQQILIVVCSELDPQGSREKFPDL